MRACVRKRRLGLASPRDLEGLVLCFGVGINNFGGERVRTADVITAVEREGLPVVAAYGSTGNLAVAARATSKAGVRSLLRRVSGRDWAILPINEARLLLDVLPAIRQRGSVRWTPGLAFRAGGSAAIVAPMRDTPRACFRWFSPNIVAIQKCDVLDGSRLDRRRRRGGWGAVSADVAAQLGGTWTAWSARTVAALVQRADDSLVN